MLQIISGYISVLITMVGVYVFEKIVINDTWEIKKELRGGYYLLLFSIPQTFIFLNLNGIVKSILMTIINVLFIKKISLVSYKKAILMTIMYMSLFLINDFIEMYFVTKVMGISIEYCFNTLAGGVISNLIICILFLLTTILLKNYLQKIVNTEISNNKKIVFLSVLTLISVFVFFYELGKEFRLNQNFWIYILIIVILISDLLNLMKQTIENNKIKKIYDNLLEFMTTYEEEIENQRTLRHETKNEFLAIRAKICDKEKESEIVNYIDEILGDTYAVKKEKYAKFGYLPANGIKGLCYFKVQKAEEKGIHVSINISKKIKESTIFDLDLKRQRDFAKILGVFIDNAIEASAESKDKELGIEAYSNIENEFRMIISNTYNNKIEEEKIGKESFSTKGKKRGHGLLLVNDIIKNNSIFETKREIKNDIYSQMIIVKKVADNKKHSK